MWGFRAALFEDGAAGLDRVTGLFADGYAAWVWLTTPRPSLDGAEPLALLARGEVERVAEAAQGDFA